MKKLTEKIIVFETAEEVLVHGNEQQGKGLPLVACFLGITNPEKAYIVATELVKRKNYPPTTPASRDYFLFMEEMQKFFDENGIQKFPGNYVIHDDRIIMYQPMRNLLKRFESDIIYDCHQLQTKTSRSAAGKEIIRRGRESLKAMAEFLFKQRNYNDDVLLAATIILCWLSHKYKLGGIPETYSDVDGWIAWANANAIKP